MGRGLDIVVGLTVLLAGAPALAAESAESEVERRRDPWGVEGGGPYVRFEADGTATPGVWPNPSLGGDVAIVAGRPRLHARVAVGAAATPTFTLGERGKVGTVVETSDLRVCTAAHRWVHRVRLCGGFQAGVMHLRWGGFAEPGRRDLPWFSFVAGGDYALAMGRIVDLHAGVGFGVPVVGQELVTRTRDGARDVQRSGRVSSTFRIGLGFRLG